MITSPNIKAAAFIAKIAFLILIFLYFLEKCFSRILAENAPIPPPIGMHPIKSPSADDFDIVILKIFTISSKAIVEK